MTTYTVMYICTEYLHVVTKTLCLSVPTTRDSPHETRESNYMRSRRNISVHHYQLDSKGNPIAVDCFPNALTGNSLLLACYNCATFQIDL